MQRFIAHAIPYKLSLFLASILTTSAYPTLIHATDKPKSENTVIISAPERFKHARTELLPNIGTTVYSIDQRFIDSMSQGDNTPFNEVLLHLPGIARDSKASGSLHIRDDHGNAQYRINGIELPEGISGFGQSIDTHFVNNVDFVTGALPAQYGLRTAGIIDIQTKEGNIKPGGRIGLQLANYNHAESSAEVFGSVGALNYYLSGSYLRNSIGIENPTARRKPIHDDTRQTKSFGNLSYYFEDDSRVSLLFGTYNGHFQIPNNPDQTAQFSLTGFSNIDTGFNNIPSSSLKDEQEETNRFVVLAYQKTFGDVNFQLSSYHQFSRVLFKPDIFGDLVYNGVATHALRSSSSNGLQFDVSYKLSQNHTFRSGLAFNRQHTDSNNRSQVFPLSDGVPSADPITILDESSKLGTTSSFYLQDQWSISRLLTVNYGVRYDRISAYIEEQQWSPRVNLAFQATENTALHAGYSRYFNPPSQKLLSQNSINKYDK
ncbi:MAG: TonB-dependent receptor [Solimicrobium sp.]|nr:TonB-dependent receptor [Solimicrobium sp.]